MSATQESASRAASALPPLLLAAAWVLLCIAVDPRGDFPLNDDWSYGRAVQNLIEHGTYRLTGFTSMPLLTQVLWGALFCLPFGFSFTALRVSTLTLGLVGVLATYGLLRRAGACRGVALLGSALLGFNPLYFELSHTFMTDVPFVALAALALLSIARAMQHDRTADWTLGMAAATLATLIRQVGLVLPVAWSAGLLARDGLRRRPLLLAATANLVVGGSLSLYLAWLAARGGLPERYPSLLERTPELMAQGLPTLGAGLLDGGLAALAYVGLFLSPLLLLAAEPAWRSLPRAWRPPALLAGLLLAGLALARFARQGRLLPELAGNVLFDLGLGPVLVRGAGGRAAVLPSAVPWALTAVGLAGGALLLLCLGRAAPPRGGSGAAAGLRATLFAAFLVYLLPIVAFGFYDRYLLPLLLFGAGLVVVVLPGGRPRGWMLGTAAAATAAMALFSVAATHDYLAWNRARWAALERLVGVEGVPPERIDGGFEFNGWYGYDPAYVRRPGRSWWWVAEDEYRIALGEEIGYEPVGRQRFRRWLPPGNGEILVLRRTTVPLDSLFPADG